MNQQNLKKLKLLLSGLGSRFAEGQQIFKAIEFIGRSGRKEFRGTGKGEGTETISFHFNGATKVLSWDQLEDELVTIAAPYEAMEVIYRERGTDILLQGDEKGVRIKYIDQQQAPQDTHQGNAQISQRDYLIQVGPANALLKEIGILTQEGKVKNDMIRKYNQIDHFVALIKDLLEELGDLTEINVVDCGCGKSYLSFVLNYYFTEVMKRKCHMIGLDHSPVVIEASRKMAKNLGYQNMTFIQGDIADYEPDHPIHLVISLHACDTATDMALALGIRCNSQAIVSVPCCHRELLGQYQLPVLQPILKHGILKARMADLITDGLRSLYLEAQGYRVSLVEYVSPLETPKNLLLRAVRTNQENPQAMAAYLQLKKTLGVHPSLEKFTEA